MTETIEKAVALESLERVRDVIGHLERLYDRDTWTGGLLFADSRGGFLLVACFNADQYVAFGTPFETLFPERDLRPLTLEEALMDGRRYQPWLMGDIPGVLRGLRLLPA